MRYRGLLSYRHFKILAWLFIIFSQIIVIAELKGTVGVTPINSADTLKALDYFSGLAMPMLLISGLSIILNGRDSYKTMLIRNGAITLGFFLVFLFVYERYILGLFSAFTGSIDDAASFAKTVLTINNDNINYGYFSFNIFIDIFLCTLVMFFINYEPKKYFKGKKIYLFRLMVLIPITYEFASIILKFFAAYGKIQLSLLFSPFLTTKSPLVFFLFMSMALFIKRREKRFLKHGKTKEDYNEFLKTNTNSFQFSRFMIIMILIFAAADYFLLVITLIIIYRLKGSLTPEEVQDTVKIIKHVGIGSNTDLIGLIPFLILFSYNKLHKRPIIDIAIPIIGVILIVFLYFDSIFVIIRDLAGVLVQSMSENMAG